MYVQARSVQSENFNGEYEVGTLYHNFREKKIAAISVNEGEEQTSCPQFSNKKIGVFFLKREKDAECS